jgi:hypothetical protein
MSVSPWGHRTCQNRRVFVLDSSFNEQTGITGASSGCAIIFHHIEFYGQAN